MDGADRPLVLSRRLVRAHGDGAVSHGFLRTRVEITARGWALLESFHDPTVPAELFDRLGLDDARRLEYARAISGFVAAGVLVPPDEVEYLYREGQALVAPFRSAMSRTETSFLGSMGPAAAADFHVVGVPFGQVSSNPGTVSGPRAIREASMAVPAQVELKTTAFRGLWDHSREQFLLAGARVADHGNVNLDPWAAAEDAYGRIHDAAGAVLDGGPGLPIFLGGDHAITEGLIRAVTARRGPLFVIHFDAHADMSETVEGMPHHHGNVMEVVRRLSSVTGVLQIGVRYLSPPWWQTPEKTTSVSVERARSATPEEILRLVPVESACYVTIDIDVLDPSEAPGTAALAPGGLRLVELEPLVRSIATAREIVGADLVEVSPDLDRSNLTAKCALRLLLALMDGVHQRRGGRSPTGAPVERLAER